MVVIISVVLAYAAARKRSWVSDRIIGGKDLTIAVSVPDTLRYFSFLEKSQIADD